MKLEISDKELEFVIQEEIKKLLQKRFNGNDQLENICRKAVREYLTEHFNSLKEYAIQHMIKLIKGSSNV